MEEESSASDDSDDSESEDDRPRPRETGSNIQPPPMAPQADKVIVKKYDPKQGLINNRIKIVFRF